jgi:putative transposase
MKDHSGEFPVKKMAKYLNVSKSRYYKWLKEKPCDRRKRDIELLDVIKKIFKAKKRRYGSPRIHKDLKEFGHRCGHNRVSRIMRENGLIARQKRKFKVTTDSKHDFPISPNLLNRQFEVKKRDKVWVSDITYISTLAGWLYLCVVIDLFSRKIVGWSMGKRITAELTKGAILMAIMQRKPADGLIFHSDRGSQYASHEFRNVLKQNKMVQSMSRKGNCWDNACAESFFSTLKMEEVFYQTYKTQDEARRSIFEYIAVFYNRQRRHSYIGYMCPDEYELKMGLPQKIA